MTYTLPAALETIDAFVDEMDTVLAVAAQDVMDVYGLDAPFRQEGTMIQPDPLRRKFARMLVERLVCSPDVTLQPADPDETPDADTTELRAEVAAARRERDELQGDLATQVQITVDVRAERDQALTDKDMWIRRHNDRVAWAVHEKEEMAAAIIKVAGERNEAQARADAAEARLARLTPERIREALLDALDPNDALDISGSAVLDDTTAAILALVAADEQAAEGEVACTCKIVNGGGCLGGCTDERVIDPACPIHGVSVPGVGGVA